MILYAIAPATIKYEFIPHDLTRGIRDRDGSDLQWYDGFEITDLDDDRVLIRSGVWDASLDHHDRNTEMTEAEALAFREKFGDDVMTLEEKVERFDN